MLIIMTAQQRYQHNIRHKQRLQNYRNILKENRGNIKVAINKYHKANKSVRKFRIAQKQGLIKVPKAQKLKYKIMVQNGQTEYRSLLHRQEKLERQFNLLKLGKL